MPKHSEKGNEGGIAASHPNPRRNLEGYKLAGYLRPCVLYGVVDQKNNSNNGIGRLGQ